MKRPRPEPDEVHLFHFNLQVEHGRLEDAACCLSPEERARADRLVVPEARRRFVACRSILRKILSQYLDVSPELLRIGLEEHGKPFLDHPSPLQFNLSHAGGRGLLAVTSGKRIGVDIEAMQEDLPFRAIATRFFCHREQQELLENPEQDQLSAFYRCWTRKEAFLKAVGTGFSDPRSFDVPNEERATLVGYRILDVAAPPSFFAALAIERAGGDVVLSSQAVSPLSA